jgi:hypothetical protein
MNRCWERGRPRPLWTTCDLGGTTADESGQDARAPSPRFENRAPCLWRQRCQTSGVGLRCRAAGSAASRACGKS